MRHAWEDLSLSFESGSVKVEGQGQKRIRLVAEHVRT